MHPGARVITMCKWIESDNSNPRAAHANCLRRAAMRDKAAVQDPNSSIWVMRIIEMGI